MAPRKINEYLEGALDSHHLVESAWSHGRVRARLKGFEGVLFPPYLTCEVTPDLTQLSLRIRNVVNVPNCPLVHELVASLNFRMEIGALALDEDGEAVLRLDTLLPQGMAGKELRGLATNLLKEALELLTVVRQELLEASLSHVGVSKTARDLALAEPEVCCSEEGTLEDGDPQPYKALAPFLEDLHCLLIASHDAIASLAGKRRDSKQVKEEVEPLLRRAARIDASIGARMFVTDPTFLPPVLRPLVTSGGEMQGRLLGFLLVQSVFEVDVNFGRAASIKQLGGWCRPGTWPRGASAFLSTVGQMIEEGDAVASELYDGDPAFKVDLDHILRPSPPVLEAALSAMERDVVGQADINAMKRELEEGGLSSQVPSDPGGGSPGPLLVPETPVTQLTCGRCGAVYMFDGSPCSCCTA